MTTPSPNPLPAPSLTLFDSMGTVGEWATALFALAALIISVLAFRTAQRSEKRSRFMELHEILTSPDAQSGRRILYTELDTLQQVAKFAKSKRRDGDYDKVNRAVGLYNTLGIYVYEGYIPRDEAIANWGAAVRVAWPHLQLFTMWRRKQGRDPELWSYLVWFAQQVNADVNEKMRLPDDWKP